MLKNIIMPTKNIHIIFTIAYAGVHIIKCKKITSTFKTWILRSEKLLCTFGVPQMHIPFSHINDESH